MTEYPVKYYRLHVLVPHGTEITEEFKTALCELTIENAPGTPINDACVAPLWADDWFTRGYDGLVGEVRYIEPSEDDRPFAEQLKSKGIMASTIIFPRVP